MLIIFPFLTANSKTSQKTNDINSNTTTTMVSLSNEESIIVSSFSHGDFLKMLKNNNTFKTDIETSLKQEVAE